MKGTAGLAPDTKRSRESGWRKEKMKTLEGNPLGRK